MQHTSLTLLPKFALICLLVVALPLTLVGVYASRTIQGTLAERLDPVLQQHVETAPRLTAQIRTAVDAAANTMTRKLSLLMIGAGAAAIGIGIGAARYLINPLSSVTATADQLARGNIAHAAPMIHSGDELEALAQSFQAIITYLQHIVKGAQKVAEGNFTIEIPPLSEHDQLGLAFGKMTTYLQELAALAATISRGDLRQAATPQSEADVLGLAIYRMTAYLQQMAQVAQKVAGGDLSEHVQPQAEHDVLGQAFAEMIGRLRHLVAKIRMDANQLVIMSQEAKDRAQEEAQAVGKNSLSVEETSSAMNQMAMSIQDVNENMQHLTSFVGETTSSIEEMTSSIKEIVRHSEQLASASEETSASIQQISASLQQIAQTAQHSKMLSDGARQDAIDGRDAVEKMIRSMRVIRQMVTVTAEAIQLLHKRTESVEKILGVIKTIADQTSLLAINASIIAKKAGERGRGFTVIAEKVRKLADQSNSSAKEIALIIRNVRKEAAHAVEVVAVGNDRVNEGVTLAESAGKALDKIIVGVNESSSVVATIADTTREQTRIGQYIMESMDQVVEMVNQIKQATKEQEKSSSYIMKQVEQMLLSSEQVKASTNEQTKAVKHVSLAMDEIRAMIQMTSERAKESTQAASMLAQHAHALKQLVSQFTI